MLGFSQQSFDSIKEYLTLTSVSDDWVDRDVLLETLDSVSQKFNDHYQRAYGDLKYIFSGDVDVSYQTAETVRLLKRWSESDDPVSTFAVIAAAMEHLGFTADRDSQHILPTLMAAMLSDVPNTLDYHNNMHFRKVVLHIIRMVVVHNNIWSSNQQNYLDKGRVSLLIAAAAVHDLGHKGDGNIIDRKYHMAQIERRSYGLASPYLKAAGLSESILSDMDIMLRTTDVSPFGDPISPASQMRRAYEFHYGSDDDMAEGDDNASLLLSDDLAVLENRAILCLMCLMLHEADIMNSAAVDYDVTCGESVSVSKELGLRQAFPEDTLLFLEKICSGRMLSDSACHLGAKNLAEILQRVMIDYKNGNKSYM
ncbi:MAG: hypothetical protein COA45_00155 [Zetaproteobacteria bacterium]|nr:MAG: hypothetical protein COA45_00155 [Zetaproteobacteria bacterium]